MFQSIKNIFRKSYDQPQHERFLQIKIDGAGLVTLIGETAVAIYSEGHMFVCQYLLPYFHIRNEQLIKEMNNYIAAINARMEPLSNLPHLLEREITNQEGYLSQIRQVWTSFLTTQIRSNYDSTKFFRIEVYLIVELMLALLKQIYKGLYLVNPEQEGLMSSRALRLRLIQAITEQYEFKSVKSIFIRNSKLGRGLNGDFSQSQIRLTTKELDELVQFNQIPVPFHESIGIMMEFYKQYRLREKVALLIEVVNKAKEEITEYRSFYGMGNTVIGSDQIMPIINYICQKTGKNIFASIQYIRALLGGGKLYNDQECRIQLRELGKTAEYSLDLVQSMASIYCHASQMNL